MNTAYLSKEQCDKIPHIKFKGFRIYNPDKKLKVISCGEHWTESMIQRHFKCGNNLAKLLLEYAQEKRVIDFNPDKYGRLKVIK